MKRRNFIQRLGVGALVLITPLSSFAAWIGEAFKATELSKAMDLAGVNNPESSDLITFSTPEIAENGSIVPVSVSTDLPNVTSIILFVEKNPTPLTSQFEITEDMEASISCRIRMGETSDVIAVVVSDGKAYKTTNTVKVTIGGCGG